MIPCSWTTC